MKFENHKNTETPKGLGERMRKELTDPVVGDLIAARKSWDEEFEKRQKERIKKLTEAEEEGRIIFSKDK